MLRKFLGRRLEDIFRFFNRVRFSGMKRVSLGAWILLRRLGWWGGHGARAPERQWAFIIIEFRGGENLFRYVRTLVEPKFRIQCTVPELESLSIYFCGKQTSDVLAHGWGLGSKVWHRVIFVIRGKQELAAIKPKTFRLVSNHLYSWIMGVTSRSLPIY